MTEEMVLGLTQGDIVSIIIAAVAAVAALFLLNALLQLGATLMRRGCLIVAIVIFVYALTRSFA